MLPSGKGTFSGLGERSLEGLLDLEESFLEDPWWEDPLPFFLSFLSLAGQEREDTRISFFVANVIRDGDFGSNPEKTEVVGSSDAILDSPDEGLLFLTITEGPSWSLTCLSLPDTSSITSKAISKLSNDSPTCCKLTEIMLMRGSETCLGTTEWRGALGDIASLLDSASMYGFPLLLRLKPASHDFNVIRDLSLVSSSS